MDLFLELGEGGSPENGSNWYLEPIPDALRWLQESRLPSGQWARYYEISTNLPLYYDRGRKRVSSFDELGLERQTGYAYHVNIDINALEARYDTIVQLGREEYLRRQNQPQSEFEMADRLKQLEEEVTLLIEQQEASGRWVKTERFRVGINPDKQWDGRYAEEDLVSSSAFIHNVRILCEFIELSKLM